MMLTDLQDYKQYLSVQDLVALGVGSRTTIWRMIKRGEITAIKTETGRVLIPRDALALYLHSHVVTPAAKA